MNNAIITRLQQKQSTSSSPSSSKSAETASAEHVAQNKPKNKNSATADDLVFVFNKCFAHAKNISQADACFLIPNASEPIYIPSAEKLDKHLCLSEDHGEDYSEAPGKIALGGIKDLSELPQGHKICFTKDYAQSALHEVAHWCVAGHERRQQVDYAYWYAPDGRDLDQQKRFESVEVKPQAIEWAFSIASKRKFSVSNDNLSLKNYDSSAFEAAVQSQLVHYIQNGFPNRARLFLSALCEYFSSSAALEREFARLTHTAKTLTKTQGQIREALALD